jgi:hypothetical protein
MSHFDMLDVAGVSLDTPLFDKHGEQSGTLLDTLRSEMLDPLLALLIEESEDEDDDWDDYREEAKLEPEPEPVDDDCPPF